MNKTVVIHLGSGDLTHGFPNVTVRFWDDRHPRAEQFVGSLPAVPALVESYQAWQSTYRALCDRQLIRSGSESDDTLEIAESGITHVSYVSFQALSQQLQQQVNGWLQSEGFLTVERQLRSQLHPDAEIRVIFEANDDLLRRLPWHCWHFFRDYAHAEVALSCPEYKRRESSRAPIARKRVRILAILGNSKGINIETERQMLQALPDSDTHFLVTPSRQALDRQLWDTLGWDILFFAGHSHTEGQTGRIYINENSVHNSLTIEQLGEALNTAIDNGLKLAIFNSCDGVGLAQALEKLQIPQVIVMREPVPNLVAQEFFKCFLEAYATERLPLYQAVRQARRRLQGLEDDFPGASWLPVICQNPAIDPPTWLQLGGLPPCPYQGLFAFQEEEAPLFFGREQFTQKLVAAVKRKALVAVVGPSGSGKSSVVFAGLVARLRSSAQNSPIQIVSFRPGVSPFDALAEALARELPEITAAQKPCLLEGNQSTRFKTLELAVMLQQESQALCHLIETLIRYNPETHLLLIADQFEELYTLCPKEFCQPFLDTLLHAVQLAPAFTLVLTLRADFYGYALSDRRFSDVLQGSVYNLGPMSQEELQRAIAQPAAQMQVKLEEGLADKLIQATWGHAGRLPLLEFALTQLWAKQQAGWLTHRAYAEIGGVEEAIATHAEGVYAQLEGGDRYRMQQILVQLAEPEAGIDPSRRLATRDEVGEANWDLVTRLASSRLVVTNRNEATGEETVEIVHEALLRSWGRLEQWIEVDGEFRRWQEGLRIVRRQWESSGQEEEALLRGKLLTDAKHWYASRDEELSSRDREFIHLSLLAQSQENKRRKRRRQTIVSSLIAGLIAALMLAGLAWWGWQNSAISEVRAISANSDALFISDRRLESLVEALRAEQKLKTLSKVDVDTQTQAELALRQAISRADEKNRFSGHDGGVTSVAFSRDGQLIASASQDHTVKLWEPDGSLITTLKGHNAEVWGVAISPDSQLIASASDDHTAKLWRRDGSLLVTFRGHSSTVKAVAFSPDGQTIASASADQTIQLWNQNGARIKTLKGHTGIMRAVTFSPDGQTIASASDDQTVKLWNQNGAVKTLQGHTDKVYGVAFSRDGQWIASASADQTIKLWKSSDGTLQSTLDDHRNSVQGIAFSADSQLLVSANYDKTINLWKIDGRKTDGTLLKTFKGHSDGVMGVAFSPDHQTIASASLDGTVRLWRPVNPLLTDLKGHSDAVWDVAFSQDNQLIASASADQTIKLWKRDGILQSTLKGHTDIVYGVAFSPNSQIIASASRDNTIRLWTKDSVFPSTLDDHNHWVNHITLKDHSGDVNRIAFSPDGQSIASASADQTVKLWSPSGILQSTLPRRTDSGHTDIVYGVAFSPDSQVIASASNDKTIKLWKRDGSLLRTLLGHHAAVNAVTFSPDGQFLASASSDKMVKLWKRDGSLFATLLGHKSDVLRVAFSPDSQILASTSIDKTVKLWRQDGSLLSTLNGYRENVIGVAFSPDGQVLATTSGDETIALWNLNSVLSIDTLLKFSCNWLKDYLETSSEIGKDDRNLCKSLPRDN